PRPCTAHRDAARDRRAPRGGRLRARRLQPVAVAGGPGLRRAPRRGRPPTASPASPSASRATSARPPTIPGPPTTGPTPGFSWPDGFYDAFWGDPAAVRRLGSATVDGVDTDVIGFVLPDYPAWFRLWIGPDRRVRRMQMLADAHVMIQTFRAYDQPLNVQPPTGGGTT
ncbi:MAG: hypothetical protein ACRDUY_16440, partial [Nitriliruptorales bacterium]